MPKPNLNILRTLRIQLKTGYLKEEPPAYKIMKRYPPLHRDTQPPIRKVEIGTIPYAKYYQNAVDRNPLFVDEHVYPAYWQQEPSALILAKKQYELIQQGQDEATAYKFAVTYVEQLESKAFEEMKGFLRVMNSEDGAKASFASEPNVIELIQAWRQKLQETSYFDMELADQGEIDYLIQTKILKWNEVERERRMKDPVFVIQFEKLRLTIFPEIGISTKQALVDNRDGQLKKILTLNGIDLDRIGTAAQFFYEDYVFYFEKLKAQPLLGRWSEKDRGNFSRWIIDTLAVRQIMEKGSMAQIQRYLDTLRAQFFPMVNYPDRAAEFSLPPIQDLKQLLYTNDIGYKRQDEKLFIKRFYRLPLLLFPKETFTTSLIANQPKLEAVLSEEASLLKEMNEAGLDEATMPELQQQLQQFMSRVKSRPGSAGKYSSQPPSQKAGIDMSILDDLLRDADDEEDEAARLGGLKGAAAPADVALRQQGGTLDGEVSRGLLDLSAPEKAAAFAKKEQLPADEWAAVVAKHIKTPETALEVERDRFFGRLEPLSWEEATSEIELETFARSRLENQVILRARCGLAYEEKEAARRRRDWAAKGVWVDKLPHPTLTLL